MNFTSRTSTLERLKWLVDSPSPDGGRGCDSSFLESSMARIRYAQHRRSRRRFVLTSSRLPKTHRGRRRRLELPTAVNLRGNPGTCGHAQASDNATFCCKVAAESAAAPAGAHPATSQQNGIIRRLCMADFSDQSPPATPRGTAAEGRSEPASSLIRRGSGVPGVREGTWRGTRTSLAYLLVVHIPHLDIDCIEQYPNIHRTPAHLTALPPVEPDGPALTVF